MKTFIYPIFVEHFFTHFFQITVVSCPYLFHTCVCLGSNKLCLTIIKYNRYLQQVMCSIIMYLYF